MIYAKGPNPQAPFGNAAGNIMQTSRKRSGEVAGELEYARRPIPRAKANLCTGPLWLPERRPSYCRPDVSKSMEAPVGPDCDAAHGDHKWRSAFYLKRFV
jgi:hypothetical protein